MKENHDLLNEKDLMNFDVYFPPFRYWSKNNLSDSTQLNNLISKEKINEGNIYIHFPFCPLQCKICPYLKLTNEHIIEVSNLIIEEIKLYGQLYKRQTKIRSILIGGGTPNFIPEIFFEKMLTSLKNNFMLEDMKQFAIELRPGIEYKKHIEILLKFFKPGILHISLGLQSSYSEKIKLWRKPAKGKGLYYSKEDIEKMILFLHEKEIKNINIDFMVENTNAFLEEKNYIKKLIKKFNINKISIYTIYSKFMGRKYTKEVSQWNFKEVIDLRKEELKICKSLNFNPLIWPIYFVKKGFKANLESLTQFEGKTLFAIGPSARGTIRTNNLFLIYENSKNLTKYKKNILNNEFPISLLYEYPKNIDKKISDNLREIYTNYKEGFSRDAIKEIMKLAKLGQQDEILKKILKNYFKQKHNKLYLNTKGLYLIDAVYWALWKTIEKGFDIKNKKFIKISKLN